MKKIFILSFWLAATAIAFSQGKPPENLTSEVDQSGHVVLRWKIPTGQFPIRYDVQRSENSGDFVEIAKVFATMTTQFTDYNVVPPTFYTYLVKAVYSDGKVGPAMTFITATPPPSGLRFTLPPVTTALLEQDYWYAPKVSADPTDIIDYTFGGPHPSGMTINTVFGGLTYLQWTPHYTGEYNVTLIATSRATKATAVQEFSIKVADRPGTITGFVRNTSTAALPNTLLRFWQVGSGTSMKYETVSDSNGNFTLENVQAGKIYAYAKPESDEYAPQWYINAPTIDLAIERVLNIKDTLRFEFYILPSNGTLVPISGIVHDEQMGVIENAKVSFIRKDAFIYIGDTSRLNNWAEQYEQLLQRSTVIDTSVMTDANGTFSVQLPVGREYYTIVEKYGYLKCFVADQTNAMEAKAFRIEDSRSFGYTLKRVSFSENKLYGSVLAKENGLSKQATIILIDGDMKRGAGGGGTYSRYRTTLSDSNGVFFFDNLPNPGQFALLAIPLDKSLAPQYYGSSGSGSSNFIASEELTPHGTMQNIDFQLRPVVKGGIGSLFGRVMVRASGNKRPAPGTLVQAINAGTKQTAGYAVTDSAGYYSIMDLAPGDYNVYADNPNYSYAPHYGLPKADVALPAQLAYNAFNDFDRVKEVNFIIDDLLNPTSIDLANLPKELTLFQNYPNPFNPSTTIHFMLPKESIVRLTVLNSLGSEVMTLVDGKLAGGLHVRTLDASSLSGGVYFYQLQSGNQILTKSMVLIK